MVPTARRPMSRTVQAMVHGTARFRHRCSEARYLISCHRRVAAAVAAAVIGLAVLGGLTLARRPHPAVAIQAPFGTPTAASPAPEASSGVCRSAQAAVVAFTTTHPAPTAADRSLQAAVTISRLGSLVTAVQKACPATQQLTLQKQVLAPWYQKTSAGAAHPGATAAGTAGGS